ncbi:pyridoxamine 5'-phosphate oxidase family protein [Streptomyces genisteinicus]|uniref:Pyridoxamine 5'-phosphate oxidase family protein n=1 Tax=Streptomyces genisteinicus TaxID=2768068 RepID=A0A7H0HUR7_9ACTN|nr:pyridoxamine 5'-phosphate oxidase family protein [Streptomyces genisteinicus]QNP64283.1 pyridoxamine 5'-phosphate oxidase family protein [Streptomyces genisteinicus]
MPIDDHRAIELLTRVGYGRLATSMRAMPFVAPAHHIVEDGAVLLRMHGGFDYHHACNGSVVAYGADNLNTGAAALWSVQFTGTARITEPSEEQVLRFGARPHRIDGQDFRPVHLRIDPQFVTVHTVDYVEEHP